MGTMVGKMLRRHGTRGNICRGDEKKAVRCFFQPVNSTSQRSMVRSATPIGLMSQGEYIYIGPAEPAVQEGDVLELGQEEYILRRVEAYRYRDRVVYYWALCSRKEVGEAWGT